MQNVVGLNGQPVEASTMRQRHRIPAEIAVRIRETDAAKLLGFFDASLPVDEPEFQAKYVLDQDGWIDEVIVRLRAEKKRRALNRSTKLPVPDR